MKNIFFEKAEQNVSEKYLSKVLVTSICSILLCMCCFVSATWAWYQVSVENMENVIQVAIEPNVAVTINGENSSLLITDQTNNVTVENIGDGDFFQKKSTLYVTLLVDGRVLGYVTLSYSNNYVANVQINTDQNCSISWVASWFEPSGANPLNEDIINIITTNEITLPVGTQTPTEVKTEHSDEISQTTEAATEALETTT